MKLLIGLSNGGFASESKNYKMCIVDVDEVTSEKYYKNEWIDLDIDKLKECCNIKVDVNNFKSIEQDPKEYLEAEFDVNKLIGFGRSDNDFQITNVYYDENNQPQLFRIVNSSGDVSMHDISELEYRKDSSIYGQLLDKLPNFVRKESLSDAYNWWKAKDEAGAKIECRWISGQFEVYESMPVKLLYHYLIGVKGFKVGYHTTTEITEDYSSEILHEYLLFKDTVNIKLEEAVPKEQNEHSLYSVDEYNIFGEKNDPYPIKRKIGYYGATMAMICSRENFPTFPTFDNRPTLFGKYDENGLIIELDYRGGLINAYNKIEEAGCIQKIWRLGEDNSFSGGTECNIIPNELANLSARLQSEKENTIYGHVMSATHGHWSTFNTDNWMKTIGFALSTQYYSSEFKQQIMPILNSYQDYYIKNLRQLIEEMGAKDALEAMRWTKVASKNVLKLISNVKSDSSIQKSNIDVVEEMSSLFKFKRNNYDLPDWLQIYSPDTIECLGGVELLKQTITIKGEQEAKELISVLAEGIESDKRAEFRGTNERFIKPNEIISEQFKIEETDTINESISKKR